MIELVVVYCLMAEPSRCEDRRDPLTTYDSVEACLSQAEIVAGRYLAGHPKWHLARWRCEIDKPAEDPA